MLRNVIVSEYATFYGSSKSTNFRKIKYSFLTMRKDFVGRIWLAGRSLETPALKEAGTASNSTFFKQSIH